MQNIKYHLKNYYDDLLFVPLGGTDRIGMNFYAYHYKGKWLIVDMGLGFAEESMPGIDILLPLTTFMEYHKENIIGMILTHGHEDHIGAVPYLWDRIECTIYTSPFTATLLKAKIAESRINTHNAIIEIHSGETIDLQPFTVEFIAITHSIPEMEAILIKTDRGNIFHTGDWKFDPDPILGDASDIKKLKKIGDNGILALVCDSTNIYNEGRSGSEGELSKSLQQIISKKCNSNGMIVVTTFASNVARMHSIICAAHSLGRHVILSGRSLWRLYNAAKECGYLQDVPECLPTTEIQNYKRNEVLVICTGCQGEVRATTSRVSYNDHPDINMKEGDSIIFSSSIIPGNERRILDIFNRFCKMGIEIFTAKNHFVHVSGHPNRDEIKQLYDLLRPEIVIPMHGEYMHIHEHRKFAISNGIKFAIESDVGDVIKISKKGPEKVGIAETGTLLVDGEILIRKDSSIIRDRRIMRDGGAVIVLLLINQHGKLIRYPKIFTPGILDTQTTIGMELVDILIEDIRDIFSEKSSSLRIGDAYIKKILTTKIKKIMRKLRKKEEPYVIVHIEQVTI